MIPFDNIIDRRPKDEDTNTPEVTIGSASYGPDGDAARTIDAKPLVEDHICRGKLIFPVIDLAKLRDPAYGVVKTLRVSGTVNGKSFEWIGTDGDLTNFLSAIRAAQMNITFVVASHRPEVLGKNLLSSKLFTDGKKDLVVKSDFSCVAAAYNDAINDESVRSAEYVCYVHHDVVLPEDFLIKLEDGIKKVEEKDQNWGVLGVAGVIFEHGTKMFKGWMGDRGNSRWGSPVGLPAEVATLDEVLLVTKGGINTFDENLYQEHLFGVDLCMQMTAEGRKNYAIAAYIQHNSGRRCGVLDHPFWDGKAYMEKKWAHYRPIPTTCTTI